MQGKIEEVYQELVKDEEKKDEISLDGLMAIYEVLELSGTDLETYLFNFQCRALTHTSLPIVLIGRSSV